VNASDGISLLEFLDSPLVVGDPEGRVIYANRAFQRSFCESGEQPLGGDLAALFAGGGREAILKAVAEVCESGEPVHFRLRENEHPYLAVASPIEVDRNPVGVLILFTDEPVVNERLLTFHRVIQEPLEEIQDCLEQLIEQTGGRRSEYFRSVVERGLGALVRARKWSDELHAVLTGQVSRDSLDAHFDPVRAVREVASRVSEEFERVGAELDLLVPPQLPAACGEAALLETALEGLLRHRLSEVDRGTCFALTARRMGSGGEDRTMLISVVQLAPESPAEAAGGRDQPPESDAVKEAVAALGGRMVTLSVNGVGLVTAIRLKLLEV
jgi:hypothetical protein